MFLRNCLKAHFRTQLLINNQWVNSQSGKTFKTINPATEEVIADVQRGNAADIDLAVLAAREAFDNGPWRRYTPSQRAICLNKLADLIILNQEELANLESLFLLHAFRAKRSGRTDNPLELSIRHAGLENCPCTCRWLHISA
jgi:acyl-CoA reductase-like NAD-dependent aldehyde dehydrogenase